MSYLRVEAMITTPEEGGYSAKMYDRASFLMFLETEIARTTGINGDLSLLLVKGGLRVGEAVVNNTRPFGIRGELQKNVYGIILPDLNIANSMKIVSMILTATPTEHPIFGLATLRRAGSKTEFSQPLFERATQALSISNSKKTGQPVTIMLTSDQSISEDQLPSIIQGKASILVRK